MEEDAELEEGEAKEALDPDTDFSYLDKKLQLLLGDCQKEFQGGNLSTEKLGSKYGGYGTFLPTHARVPSLLAEPHPVPPAAEPGRTAAEGTVEPMKRVAGTSIQQVSVKDNGAAGGTFTAKKVKLKIKLGKGAAEEAQRKAIYNGLCLDTSSSASLDDDDTYSRSNVESPEPSPMSIIQIMTSHYPQGGLLSPLCDSFDIMDTKETAPGMQKSRNSSVATFNARSTGNKVDLDSPLGPGTEYRKGKGDKDKHFTAEAKKVSDLVVDADGGKRARRESDVERKGAKEPAGQWQSKAAKNDVFRGEQRELVDEKGGEGLGKEEHDSGRELLPKSSRKQLDVNRSLGGNGQKEKEGSDAKMAGKFSALKDRDSKEVSRNKDTAKVPARKDWEPGRTMDGEKDSSDKVGSLAEARKQVKEDIKEGTAVKVKESLREAIRDNQRKDFVGDVKTREPHREGVKSVGTSGGATKKTNNSVPNRKVVANDHKASKNVQDRKMSLKDIERERVHLPEPVVSIEEEKIPARVEPAPAALVVPQLVLDNWVACDKCEQWRLLMPNMNPASLPKKWRCKMMDWLPGMNNCKFTEGETTAAVYAYLGYQNPALPPAAAPALQQPPPPVVEPVLEKWADQADTKKTSLLNMSKKGVARKLVGAGVKAAGSKGVEGAVKSRNLNDVGLVDNSADGTAVLVEKHKHRVKEKTKRPRPSEGEDLRIKKKILQEQEHNVQSLQREKEAMDAEPNLVGREREETTPPEGEVQGNSLVLAKRKKLGSSDDVGEAPLLKKNKGARVKMQIDEPQAPSEEDYDDTDKWGSAQRGKREYSTQNPKDSQQYSLQDKETQQISSVLKDIRGQEREERELTRLAEERRSKANVWEKQRRSKEDQSDSEQRVWERRREADIHADRLNQAGPPEKLLYTKEDCNRSISSKVSTSSLESSGTRLKAVGSPLESTVSSSPVRVANGNREVPAIRDGPGNPSDIAMPQQSCSPGPKHGRDASRGSSWDEGEYRHAGAYQNTTRFRKYESDGEARDDDWNYDEDRGAGHGHALNHHGERQAHGSRDSDEVDGHRNRRNDHRDRDSDRGRLGNRGNNHVDQEDRHFKETTTRDDRGRPSSRERGHEKPVERPWDDDPKLDGGDHVHTRDEVAASSQQGHGTRDGVPSKDSSREGERPAPIGRKDTGVAAVGPSDVVVAIKRPGASLNARVIAERQEAAKRDDSEVGPVKTSVAEGATGSPAKKEHAQALHLANVAMKDATDLKHSADRLKGIPGNDCESTNLYLQAALKFLQAAAMLEPIHAESARQGEVTQSMTLYNDTARLCEFCAMTYKRSGDLRAAALAYTCAAVARARVMMSKQACFARDCNEFQSAAQLTSGPHNGESPSSSSASEMDNLNNHHALAPGNKVSMGKPAMVSPKMIPGATAGTSHIIPARSRPVVARFLRDANDMSALLDSWLKASEATAKAEASKDTEGMAAVKQVGELGGFGDIDGVVRLVRVAMDAIGH